MLKENSNQTQARCTFVLDKDLKDRFLEKLKSHDYSSISEFMRGKIREFVTEEIPNGKNN